MRKPIQISALIRSSTLLTFSLIFGHEALAQTEKAITSVAEEAALLQVQSGSQMFCTTNLVDLTTSRGKKSFFLTAGHCAQKNSQNTVYKNPVLSPEGRDYQFIFKSDFSMTYEAASARSHPFDDIALIAYTGPTGALKHLKFSSGFALPGELVNVTGFPAAAMGSAVSRRCGVVGTALFDHQDDTGNRVQLVQELKCEVYQPGWYGFSGSSVLNDAGDVVGIIVGGENVHPAIAGRMTYNTVYVLPLSEKSFHDGRYRNILPDVQIDQKYSDGKPRLKAQIKNGKLQGNVEIWARRQFVQPWYQNASQVYYSANVVDGISDGTTVERLNDEVGPVVSSATYAKGELIGERSYPIEEKYADAIHDLIPK